ncbi:MAG: glycosyltransferase, partial [bacterium]
MEEKGIQKVFEERPRHYLNICLVPSWKVWQWRTIRQWTSPNQVPTTYLPVFTLPWVGRSINWWFYARSLRRYLTSPSGHDSTTQQLNNLTTEGSPDTFYVPWLYPDGVAVARAIRGTGARLWLMALGSDTFHLRSPLRRKMILESCRAAEGIICVANVLADRLADAGVPREKLHVVPNGVDAALFAPQTLDHRPETIDRCDLSAGSSKAEAPVVTGVSPVEAKQDKDAADTAVTTEERFLKSNASPSILFVGNLVPVKGPDILLEAFALLKKSMFSFRCSPSLLLIGDGPMRGELEQKARELGISDSVHFLG